MSTDKPKGVETMTAKDPTSTMPTTPPVEPAPLPSDRRIVAAVWPLLLASAVGLLPFTVFSTFLVAIADAVGDGEAAVGALRGLGGIGAVLAGVAVAPLIGRIPPARVAAAALTLLAVASLVGTLAWLPALAAFCLAVGVSSAMLYPALSTAAADHYGDSPAAGRAATLVMSTQTLAATLAAPLVALPALWWGWQGDLVAVAVVALLVTPALLRHGRASPASGASRASGDAHQDAPQRQGYFAAFRLLAAVPGARPLLLVAFGRAGAFMGHLSFLAPFYSERFGLQPSAFGFVWTLSGASFFVGHLVSGRLLNRTDSDERAQRAMIVSLVVAGFALAGVYSAPVLAVALVSTALLSASHAVIAAAVVTLLVRRCGDVRGTALSLNSAGMNLGTFLGAAVGGAGLAAGGYRGAGVVFICLTAVSLAAALAFRPMRDGTR